MKIGCHLSSSGGYLAMARTAISIDANVFQFFTRNPRGGGAREIDLRDVAEYHLYAQNQRIGPILAHAPYTLNAASAERKTRDFAEFVFTDDLLRLQHTPGTLYNFHPGSHVGQGAEIGITLISELVCRAIENASRKLKGEPIATTILLETMSGKGSEVGRTFEELRAIIDAVESVIPQSMFARFPVLGVCLDTCHVWDAGYDIAGDLDGVIGEFDRIIGLDRLKAIHLNDSMNPLASHKDRHQQIGKGKIGLEALKGVINHPALFNLPFFLETPCDLQEYKAEIALLRSLRKL